MHHSEFNHSTSVIFNQFHLDEAPDSILTMDECKENTLSDKSHDEAQPLLPIVENDETVSAPESRESYQITYPCA